MTRVAATKLRSTISDLLDRVVHHGERVRLSGMESRSQPWSVRRTWNSSKQSRTEWTSRRPAKR